ncbi:hypothetical protein AMEX_G15501 [Astyanax mexicanus]|uniref:Uncharacterized protein n=1 Tax=Astyanax mexicanus TaxID=7994 RepID=A0A8T2LG72_ASTMX|nr:hypothetical protein AMEX_G15501 [Astyanax mexicanus]
MGKQRKKRPNPTQKIYGQRNGLQTAESISAPYSPSSLSSSISAFGGSHVSAQTLSHNSISGPMTINNFFGAVTPNASPPVKEDIPVAQQPFTASEESSVFMTPKSLEKETPYNLIPQQSKEAASRVNVSRRKLNFDEVIEPQQTLDDVNEMQGESVHSPAEEPSITGQIKCTKVIVSYCCECGAAIRRFKSKDFNVKCSKCKLNWNCAKVPCTCEAEITIELCSGETQMVALNDSLLRLIVSYNTEGYCDTNQIEEKILKMGNIRVDFENGKPKSVQVTPTLRVPL